MLFALLKLYSDLYNPLCHRLMKKITFTLLITITIITSAFAQNIDSLQKQRDSVQHICAQADLYTNLADSLIQYNQPKTRVISIADAAQAGNYVLKAIQINKMFNDTIAVRNNFDRLGQAYVMQNKFAEAKWYFLQSNRISRDRHDVPHIISGLIQLASVKATIKDYALAEKDLQEAIVLTKYSYNVPQQIEVERKLAVLYDKADKLNEAKSMVAHYTMLTDSLKPVKPKPVLAMQKPKVKPKKVSVTLATKQRLAATVTPVEDSTIVDVTSNLSAQHN
jgi:tetratricopeptide (TPR) repeat protein